MARNKNRNMQVVADDSVNNSDVVVADQPQQENSDVQVAEVQAEEIIVPEVTEQAADPEVTETGTEIVQDSGTEIAKPEITPDAVAKAVQTEAEIKANWTSPEKVQERHLVAALVNEQGTVGMSPTEFAKLVASQRMAAGGPKMHPSDNKQIKYGAKTYYPKASAVAGSKNEYVGYWELVKARLADPENQGAPTQGELARLVGRRDFIRYALDRGYLVFLDGTNK